jgi:hypothetical protein
VPPCPYPASSTALMAASLLVFLFLWQVAGGGGVEGGAISNDRKKLGLLFLYCPILLDENILSSLPEPESLNF